MRASSPSSTSGSSIVTSFVGGADEPRGEVSDRVEREVLEARVALGLRRHLGDVELVVDVAVDVEALLLEDGDRLARELEWDRLVPQELTGGRVGDDGALVADDRVVDPGLTR